MRRENGVSLTTLIIVVVIAIVLIGVGAFLFIATSNNNGNQNIGQNVNDGNENGGTNLIKLSSPREIFSTSLPNSGSLARASDTYKASGSMYIKNNSNNFNKYFSYEDGKGWTVKKEGLYSIISEVNASSYNDSASGLISTLIVNNKEYEIVRDYYTDYQPAVASAQHITYLKEGDVIDFKFVFESTCDYNYNNITVYAMFN